MSDRFVAKLLPNSTLVQGVFDTHKKEFLMNPKYPAHNPKPYTFTNLTNLNRVVAEANKAHVEETKAASEAAKVTKAKPGRKPKFQAQEPVKELTTAEKRAAGLAKARQARSAKAAERKAQDQVAA